MTRPRRMPLLLAALGLLLAAGAWHWASRPAAPSAATSTAAVAQAQDRPTPKGVADVPVAAPITLPIYVPDSRGLPASSAPLRESHQALTAAAAAGNATAACRLANLETACFAARHGAFSDVDGAEMSTTVRDLLVERIARRASRAEVPAGLDRVIEALEAQSLAEDRSAREYTPLPLDQCYDLPTFDTPDLLASLRGAALAGHPEAMAAYVRGDPLITAIGMQAATTPSETGPGYRWIRDPAFDDWRREAPIIRDAGLARGDIPMLLAVLQGAPMGIGGITGLSDIENAAAIRALAGILGADPLPGSATVGLDIPAARQADALSEAWIAAHRRHHALPTTPEDVAEHLLDARSGGLSCE